jgi:hypothetical protein
VGPFLTFHTQSVKCFIYTMLSCLGYRSLECPSLPPVKWDFIAMDRNIEKLFLPFLNVFSTKEQALLFSCLVPHLLCLRFREFFMYIREFNT